MIHIQYPRTQDKHSGLQGILKSYFRNRVQFSNINGSTSDFRKTSCGVPWGSILGPLLFLIYMNDLPNSVENANISSCFLCRHVHSCPFKGHGKTKFE